jgi:hypothetical protein
MQSTTFTLLALLGLSLLPSGCGSDDDDDGSPNAGTAARCPSGTESYYDEFIAIPQCATTFDCIASVGCTTLSQQACDVYRNSLTGIYCAQPGAVPDAAELEQSCTEQYDAIVQDYPDCVP